jgi:hypothetical protein
MELQHLSNEELFVYNQETQVQLLNLIDVQEAIWKEQRRRRGIAMSERPFEVIESRLF